MTYRKIKMIRYIAWFFSFVIMALIFFSSSQDGELSSATSSEFITAVLNVFCDDFDLLSVAEKQVMIDSLQHVVRKCAHFTVYFALGSSLMTAIATYSIKTSLHIFLSATLSFLYAAFDEIHQTFVAGRAGMLTDVLIDFVGSCTGILFVFLIISIYRRIISRSTKKMQKKELMKRLGELVSTVERLNSNINELKAENRQLKAKIEELEASHKEPCDDVNDTVGEIPNSEADGFTVKIIDEVELSEENSEEPRLNDQALEYGAAVIGKITVEAAHYCEIVSSFGGDDLKELLGLIMGKSEVCKSEILNIAISELTIESKREMIDAQLNEAVEYFKSISEQTK